MDRFLTGQAAIDLLGDIGCNRRTQLDQGQQHLIGRVIDALFVGVEFLLPVAPTRSPDIPVGELIIQEVLDLTGRQGQIIVIIGLTHIGDDLVQATDHPAVKLTSVLERHIKAGGIDAVIVGIESEQVVDVFQGAEVFAEGLAQSADIEFGRLPDKPFKLFYF